MTPKMTLNTKTSNAPHTFVTPYYESQNVSIAVVKQSFKVRGPAIVYIIILHLRAIQAQQFALYIYKQ